MDQEFREASPPPPEAVFRRKLADYIATTPHLYDEERALLPSLIDLETYASRDLGPCVHLARSGSLSWRKELTHRSDRWLSPEERAKTPTLREMRVFPAERLLTFLHQAFDREGGVDLAVVGGAPLRWANLDARHCLVEEDVIAYLAYPFRTVAREYPLVAALSDIDAQIFGSKSGRFFEDRGVLEDFLGGEAATKVYLSGLQIGGWESGWRKGLVYAEGCFQMAPVEGKMGRGSTQVLHILPSRAGSVYGSAVAEWAGPLHFSACESTLRSPFVLPLFDWREQRGERGQYLVVDLFGAIEMAQKGISLENESGKFVKGALPINIPIPELFFLPGGDSFMATIDLIARLAVDEKNIQARDRLMERRGRSRAAREVAWRSYADYPPFDVDKAERRVDEALGLLEFGKGVLVSQRGGTVRMIKDGLPRDVAAEFSKLVSGVTSIKTHFPEVVADLPQNKKVNFQERVTTKLTQAVLTGNPQVLFCLLASPDVVLSKELVQGTGLGDLFPKLRSKITPELLAELKADDEAGYFYRRVDQKAVCRLFKVDQLEELFELGI